MLTHAVQELYDAVDEISKERVGKLIERNGGVNSAVVSGAAHYGNRSTMCLPMPMFRYNPTSSACSPAYANSPCTPACFLLTTSLSCEMLQRTTRRLRLLFS